MENLLLRYCCALFFVCCVAVSSKPISDDFLYQQQKEPLLYKIIHDLNDEQLRNTKRSYKEDLPEIGQLTATLLNDIVDEDNHPKEGDNEEFDINSLLLDIIKQKEWLKASSFYADIIKTQAEQMESLRIGLLKMRRRLKTMHTKDEPVREDMMLWLKDMIGSVGKLGRQNERLGALLTQHTTTNTQPPEWEIAIPDYIQRTRQGYVFKMPDNVHDAAHKMCKKVVKRKKRSIRYPGTFGAFEQNPDHNSQPVSNDMGGIWGPPVDKPVVNFDEDFWQQEEGNEPNAQPPVRLLDKSNEQPLPNYVDHTGTRYSNIMRTNTHDKEQQSSVLSPENHDRFNNDDKSSHFVDNVNKAGLTEKTTNPEINESIVDPGNAFQFLEEEQVEPANNGPNFSSFGEFGSNGGEFGSLGDETEFWNLKKSNLENSSDYEYYLEDC